MESFRLFLESEDLLVAGLDYLEKHDKGVYNFITQLLHSPVANDFVNYVITLVGSEMDVDKVAEFWKNAFLRLQKSLGGATNPHEVNPAIVRGAIRQIMSRQPPAQLMKKRELVSTGAT